MEISAVNLAYDSRKISKLDEGLVGEIKNIGVESFINPRRRNTYEVHIYGESEGVMLATKTIIDSLGIPKFVFDPTHFEIVDNALNPYGKETRRKFRGFAVGRQVIDIN
ncbi:hypothetical protein HYT23_03740 [Candidatus Pacearchaeota archaeon]|nr:hypothetical protein [Candidatus Pacearchaeota archaeon]